MDTGAHLSEAAVAARPSPRARWTLIAILIIAGARVIFTYPVFSQTYDEGAHIAAGMEWLVHGTYSGEPQHPPLARIFAALGPYAAGARSSGHASLPEQGNEILHSGSYLTMLSLARAGILLFFLLSIVGVWLYAFRLAGNAAATIAAILYSNLPPVLAHAGLATTDMAVTCGIVWSFYLLHRWLTEPSRARAALLGLAVAASFVSKFSSGLFLAAGGLVTIACILMSRQDRPRYQALRLLGHAAIAMTVFFLATWATYQFSFEPLRGANRLLVHDLLHEQPLYQSAYSLINRVPVPAPEIAGGLAQMLLHNRGGHPSYLFGEHRIGGWWYYFPVAVAVKTTIVLLFAAIASLFFLAHRARKSGNWQLVAPIFSAVAIVASCLPVDINIGVRHVLPIFPLMAISAGTAAATLWTKGARTRFALVGLLLVEVFTSARAHPDYLPYFNLLAGREPHRVLLDSNLDWGQDLLRLSERSRELEIDGLRLSYFGTADLSKHDLPPLLAVTYDKPSPGWFAVSESHIGSPEFPVTFKWLDQFEPVEQIGKSIRLYRIPGPQSAVRIPERLETFLVPLQPGEMAGADGRTWIITLHLVNRGVRPLTVTHARQFIRIPAGARTAWEIPFEAQAPLLQVASQDAGNLSGFVSVVSSLNGGRPVETMQIPIIHARSLSGEPLSFTLDVACDSCRRMLRIFDLSKTNSSVSVVLDRDGQAGQLRRRLTLLRSATGDAAAIQVPLDALFPELSTSERADLTILSDGDPSRRQWAYVTVTSSVGSELILPLEGRREQERPNTFASQSESTLLSGDTPAADPYSSGFKGLSKTSLRTYSTASRPFRTLYERIRTYRLP